MTPIVNAAELRKLVSELPEPALGAVKALFRERGWPKLTDEWETDALLWHAAQEMEAIALRSGYVNWRTPLDTERLLARILALPDDLKDLAADNAAESQVPNVKRPERWTVEHWHAAVAAIEHAEALAAKRHRHVMAVFGELTAAVMSDMDVETPADARHKVVHIVTGGRTESSRMLTGPEVRYLASVAEARAAGLPADVEAYRPDWKAEAKRLGTTVAALAKDGKAWAAKSGLTFPTGAAAKALEELTDHRIIAHLLMGAEDGETVMERTAAEVETMPAAEVDPPLPDPGPTADVDEGAKPWPAEVDHAVLERLEAAEEDRAALHARLDAIEDVLANVTELVRTGTSTLIAQLEGLAGGRRERQTS